MRTLTPTGPARKQKEQKKETLKHNYHPSPEQQKQRKKGVRLCVNRSCQFWGVHSIRIHLFK